MALNQRKRISGVGTGTPSASQGKRSRGDWDDDGPSQFEEELAFLDEVEADLQAEMREAQVSNDVLPISKLVSIVVNPKWQRPPPPKIDSRVNALCFQQVELDYYVGSHISGMLGATQGPVPIIRMFGITAEGNSVCCHIHGFAPYFYVPAQTGFKEEHLSDFKKELNSAVIKDMRSNKESISQAVLAVDICMKENIYGYHGKRIIPFLKITMALQRLIAPAKRLLELGIHFGPFPLQCYQAYEANIDFEIRLMRRM